MDCARATLHGRHARGLRIARLERRTSSRGPRITSSNHRMTRTLLDKATLTRANGDVCIRCANSDYGALSGRNIDESARVPRAVDEFKQDPLIRGMEACQAGEPRGLAMGPGVRVGTSNARDVDRAARRLFRSARGGMDLKFRIMRTNRQCAPPAARPSCTCGCTTASSTSTTKDVQVARKFLHGTRGAQDITDPECCVFSC